VLVWTGPLYWAGNNRIRMGVSQALGETFRILVAKY
jgi:hypothetical protein